MADPTKPLLRLEAERAKRRETSKPKFPPRPQPFSRKDQSGKFDPRMTRLQESLGRDPTGYELRNDPTALAPERLIVFEVKGAVQNFLNAALQAGLEPVAEEELPKEDGETPVQYLMVPDAGALKQLLSLWNRWQRGEELERGLTPWRDVFALLRNLRAWGPEDRVTEHDQKIMAEELGGRAPDEPIRLEIELVYRSNSDLGESLETELRERLSQAGGRVVHRSRIDDIAYHTLLVDLPAKAVFAISERQPEGIAGLDPVMYIRPQSLASGIEMTDPAEALAPERGAMREEPILALLDGVPIAQHPLLEDRLSVLDPFDMEEKTVVENRKHGTAMASLIVHGDRNKQGETPLSRKIFVVPVIGGNDVEETFRDDRLVVDMVYQAIREICDDRDSSEIVIVNLSLGNRRRSFHGIPSAWARLLDRFAWDYGLLFIVSAGNITSDFPIQGFSTRTEFEDSEAAPRSEAVIRSVDALKPERRLFSPAESLNSVTVGAANINWAPKREQQTARAVVDPHEDITTANPSGALGPGIANAVKPDILFAGGREHLLPIGGDGTLNVRPHEGQRATGLKVATPPRGGLQNPEAYTIGSSAAAALASRTAHQVYDALEIEYGDRFLALSTREKAVLLKALLAHPAEWPPETADRIKSVVGPQDGRQHVRQRDNILRYLGYGVVDGDEVVTCAADRATFWAVGSIDNDQTVDIRVPIPAIIGGQRRHIIFAATLAWITPTRPGRQSYKAVKLELSNARDDALVLENSKHQPNANQSKRGTITGRRWQSARAQTIGDETWETLSITRSGAEGEFADETVAFGLAVTLAAPGLVELYEQARSMIEIRERQRI